MGGVRGAGRWLEQGLGSIAGPASPGAATECSGAASAGGQGVAEPGRDSANECGRKGRTSAGTAAVRDAVLNTFKTIYEHLSHIRPIHALNTQNITHRDLAVRALTRTHAGLKGSLKQPLFCL